MHKLCRAIILIAAITLPAVARAAETTGAGSTFVFPILWKWAADYQTKTGDKIKYQSIGSGSGLQQIRSATVDFCVSDMPLKPDELAKDGSTVIRIRCSLGSDFRDGGAPTTHR